MGCFFNLKLIEQISNVANYSVRDTLRAHYFGNPIQELKLNGLSVLYVTKCDEGSILKSSD